MPVINHHHDGHGLNDLIIIERDERDPDAGNGSREYVAHTDGHDGLAVLCAHVSFQRGQPGLESSKPGATNEVLLAILIDRMEGFQDGPFRCRESAIVLTKLQECMHWLRHRADERARRGVLGKNQR